MKQLIAFDLDGTLAESNAPLDDEIAGLLATLLTFAQVAVISGGDWPQLKKQVIDRLPSNAELAMLWILPTAGAKLFRFTKDWQLVYSQAITPDEKSHILGALERAIAAAGLNDDPAWGPRVEDRGTQVTYSGIGQKAPLDAKRAWDPDRRKRLQLQAMLEQSLPGWSINIGGTTSVDITREEIDKGFGLRKLAEVSGVALKDMMFLGDAVFPGGNDYPAVTTGVDTVAVRDVQETKSILHALNLWFGA